MRINTLDYLRGLMALGIMIYHYFGWTFTSSQIDNLLNIIGIYGVSIFYILSGATLYIVYVNKLILQNTFSYLRKRVIRIYPLMWLSIFFTFIILGQTFSLKTYFLNLSGLFGFFAPGDYIVIGAWSIGNELVFYMLFPILVISENKLKLKIEISFVLSLLLGAYFCFDLLDSNTPLTEQWHTYINPFNQLFLFVGGMVIGKHFYKYRSNITSLILFCISLIFLLFYPVFGDQITLVSGLNRLLFSLIAFLFTLSFITNKLNFPKFLDKILLTLGHISYSLYLLHAIVFWFIARFVNRTEHQLLFLSICICLTLTCSWICYNYFEKKIVKLGKTFS